MDGNPYAPPTAAVEDIPEAIEEPPYFAVTTFKFVVLSLCTLGLYEMYWFYQNWHRIKERDGSAIMPAIRSIFSVFFCYQCFDRIRDDTSAATGATFAAGPLASVWILSQFSSWMPDPYWLIAVVSFVFIIPVQRQVNRYNEEVAPAHDRNGSFSAANWIWMVLGGGLLLLALVGVFLPETVIALEPIE